MILCCEILSPFAGNNYEVIFGCGVGLHPPAHQGSGSPLGSMSRASGSTGLQPKTGTSYFEENIMNPCQTDAQRCLVVVDDMNS